MAKSVDQAFEYFLAFAEGAGAVVHAETTNGNRSSQVTHDGAALMLAWAESTGRLVLQISQGPPRDPAAGWLVLFEVGSSNGTLLAPLTPDIDFASSVSYGFELLNLPTAVMPPNTSFERTRGA